MLTLVPTPIGNIEDITLRAIKALESADLFLCEDTRVARKLIKLLQDRLSITVKSSKYLSFHEHNQESFLSKLEPSFFKQNIVYISDAGMPCISDPGAKLVEYCIKNEIEYDVLPGPSAAITAFAASGFEGRFTFFGFLPHKGKDRKKRLEEVLDSPYFSIVFEAPHRLLKFLNEIENIDNDREIFLAKELTKRYQRFFKGTVGEILDLIKNVDIKGEWVAVISPKKESFSQSALTKQDILSLNISKKEKAKLLSKITSKSVKECYEELIRG